MRLTWRKIERSKAGIGSENLNGAIGTAFARGELVVFSHCASTLPNPKNRDGGTDSETNFSSSQKRRLAAALWDIQNIASL